MCIVVVVVDGVVVVVRGVVGESVVDWHLGGDGMRESLVEKLVAPAYLVLSVLLGSYVDVVGAAVGVVVVGSSGVGVGVGFDVIGRFRVVLCVLLAKLCFHFFQLSLHFQELQGLTYNQHHMRSIRKHT